MGPEQQPLVSIVTPVYNAAKFLTATVDSVCWQTYRNWELILVDDMSSDESVNIIKNFQIKDSRIKIVRNEENKGAALSRNAGTRIARGKYLAFLDADDLWAKTKLARQVEFMRQNGYAFSFTDYEFADEDGIPTGKRARMPTDITYRQSLKNHTIWTSTVMIDLDQIPKDIALMPDVRRGQDTATWWQILRYIKKAYSIDEVLSYYRRTNNSLSANKIKAVKRTWYLFTKVEKLGMVSSMYNFIWYGFNAVRKRV